MVSCEPGYEARRRDLRRAFPLYERWFTTNKRAIPSYDTFEESRFGTHFLKFITWCDTMNVVSPSVYASVMIRDKIHPSAWSTIDSYKLYIKDFDAVVTTDEWLLITTATIERECNEQGVGLRQFYTRTPPNKLIHLIRTRALYPRYLICDPEFAAYLQRSPDMIARMISDAVDDQYTAPSMPCDDTIMAVIRHINS